MTFPNLKAEIARNGLKTVEVAAVAGVSEKTFYNWINDVSCPSTDQAFAIQEAFFPDCSFEYLFEKK